MALLRLPGVLCVSLVFVFAACSGPTFTDCKIVCGPGQSCPAGLTCDQQRCRAPGAASCPSLAEPGHGAPDAGSGRDADADNETGASPDTGLLDRFEERAVVPDGGPNTPDVRPDLPDSDGQLQDAASDVTDIAFRSTDVTPDRTVSILDAASDVPPPIDANLPDLGSDGSTSGCQSSDHCAVAVNPNACAANYCGGILWPGSPNYGYVYGQVPFEIDDPQNLFGPAYRQAILDAAKGWTASSRGRIVIEPCAPCTGQFVSIVPGPGDGIQNPTSTGALVLPMPIAPTGSGLASAGSESIPFHVIGHQFGHAVGLADMYQRPDRAQYAQFAPGRWCDAAGRSTLPPVCKSTSNAAGAPPIAGGAFGVFDESSKMNGLPSDGVCGTSSPDSMSALPTKGDVAAMWELYLSYRSLWSPIQPVGRADPSQRPPSDLVPGVRPVGTPTIAERISGEIDLFVCGTDGGLYTNHNVANQGTFVAWEGWTSIATGCASVPAAVYSDDQHLHVAFNSADHALLIATRSGGTWTTWRSLGAPTSGASSSVAITSPAPNELQIFVRGGDGQLNVLDCGAALQNCTDVGSGSAGWTLVSAGGGPPAFKGRPAAVSALPGTSVLVGIALDGVVWLTDTYSGNWSPWEVVPGLLPANDDEPGVAASTWGDQRVDLYVRDSSDFLVQVARLGTNYTTTYDLGGGLASIPSAAGIPGRLDVTALMIDHGSAGIWWKFNTYDYSRYCNFSDPALCGVCGCGDKLPLQCQRP